jgi:hypothetical protein
LHRRRIQLEQQLLANIAAARRIRIGMPASCSVRM